VTRSNRILNRVIIALVGLVLIAVGAWQANRVYPVLATPELATPTATALWITAAVCLVIAVLAIAWILTRGRGQSRTLISRADAAGSTSITARVAADLVSEDVSRIADVVSVSARAFRVRGSVTLELTVTTRRAADVRGVVDAVRVAVERLDDVLDERLPVLLHMASGVRANSAREQRVR
jgi:hypothetical protein